MADETETPAVEGQVPDAASVESPGPTAISGSSLGAGKSSVNFATSRLLHGPAAKERTTGKSKGVAVALPRRGTSKSVWTIWHAAANGNHPRVHELIEVKHVPVDARDLDGGRTCLHWAARNADLSLIKYLLLHGADINAPDGGGSTPLHYAGGFGVAAIVLYLLEQGANNEICNEDNQTAADFARAAGREDNAGVLERWKMPPPMPIVEPHPAPPISPRVANPSQQLVSQLQSLTLKTQRYGACSPKLVPTLYRLAELYSSNPDSNPAYSFADAEEYLKRAVGIYDLLLDEVRADFKAHPEALQAAELQAAEQAVKPFNAAEIIAAAPAAAPAAGANASQSAATTSPQRPATPPQPWSLAGSSPRPGSSGSSGGAGAGAGAGVSRASTPERPGSRQRANSRRSDRGGGVRIEEGPEGDSTMRSATFSVSSHSARITAIQFRLDYSSFWEKAELIKGQATINLMNLPDGPHVLDVVPSHQGRAGSPEVAPSSGQHGRRVRWVWRVTSDEAYDDGKDGPITTVGWTYKVDATRACTEPTFPVKPLHVAKEQYTALRVQVGWQPEQLREAAANLAVALNHLAQLYSSHDQHIIAEPLLVRALGLLDEVAEGEHMDVARTLINLATCYQYRRKFAPAQPILLRAIPIIQHTMGAEHRFVAQTLLMLGNGHLALGQPEEAITAFNEAIRVFEIAESVQSLPVAKACDCLAQALLAKLDGRVVTASQLEPMMFQAARAAHMLPDAKGDAYAHLPAVLLLDGTALPAMKGNLPVVKEPLGAGSGAAARTGPEQVVDMAIRMQIEKLLLRSLDIRSALLDRYHPDVAISQTNLAAAMCILSRRHEVARVEPIPVSELKATLRKSRSNLTAKRSALMGKLATKKAQLRQAKGTRRTGRSSARSTRRSGRRAPSPLTMPAIRRSSSASNASSSKTGKPRAGRKGSQQSLHKMPSVRSLRS